MKPSRTRGINQYLVPSWNMDLKFRSTIFRIWLTTASVSTLSKNGKEKIVKLKSGAVIKYSVKPEVKKHREKIHESLQKKVDNMMKGGSSKMWGKKFL